MISRGPHRIFSISVRSVMRDIPIWGLFALSLPVIFYNTKAALGSTEEISSTPHSTTIGADNTSGSTIAVGHDANASPHGTGTTLETSLFYRASALKPRKRSVYHKNEHTDFADQVYATLRLTHTTDHIPDIVIEPAFRTVRNNPAKWDDPLLHQAYLETRLGQAFVFTTGKKVEYTGSGFLVNPSDLLNEQKDLFDPLYQQEGVFFSRLTWRKSETKVGLGLIPVRGQSIQKGKAWVTLESDLWDTAVDAQLSMQESDKMTTGFSAQKFFSESLEFHVDGRYQARQRKNTDVEWIRYVPRAGNDIESQRDDRSSLYALFGARLVMTPRRSITMEYIENESGLAPRDFARRFSDLSAETQDTGKIREPPTQYIGQRYGFIAFKDDDLIPSMQFSASLAANIQDKSTFFVLTAKRPLSNVISAELTPMLFGGTARTEFGEMPFSNVIYLTLRGRF